MRQMSNGRVPGALVAEPARHGAELLPERQWQALRRMVEEGTLTASQAEAVRAGLAGSTGPDDRRPASRSWLAEAAGYLGGALTLAGAALLVGLSWEELSRPGRVAVLATVTALLVAVGLGIAGGPRALRALAGAASTVRRRVVSVLFAVSAGTAALTAGVAATDHAGVAAGVSGLAVAAAGYLLLPALPALLAAAAMSVVTGTAVTGDFIGDTPVRMGLALIVVAAGWAALGSFWLPAHRAAALAIAGAVGLVGAQQLLGGSGTAIWAYLLTLLVAAGCLTGYALRRGVLLLAIGVLGVTLAVSEAVADWTNGAAGGAAAVLTAGAMLLLGSGIALRVHRRRAG